MATALPPASPQAEVPPAPGPGLPPDGAPGASGGVGVAVLLGEAQLPRAEARALLAQVLDCPREWLVAHPGAQVPALHARRWRELVRRRALGEPLAYLRGEREFHGHAFRVGPGVLVPRPETELLVDEALAWLEIRPGARVLELGAGSGCIGISLALARPGLEVVAVEKSGEALGYARENAERLGARVLLLQGDWYGPLDPRARFDLIVSNPPYIARGDGHLAALGHEPESALVAGADGLDDLRAILAGAPRHLEPGGLLLVEHGYDQGPAVRALALAAGLRDARTLADLAGRDRACRATAPGMGNIPS